MKSKSIPWTRAHFNGQCPCGTPSKSYDCCWRGNGCWEKTALGRINVGGGEFANDRCYASPLKGCGAKIEREHFISRNILEKLFNEPTKRIVQTSGLFFGGKTEVNISVDDFASKVLCDIHNRALGVLDAAAGDAFDTIENIGHAILKAGQPSETNKHFYLSSGLDMERWLIKVFCGLVAAKKVRGTTGTLAQRSELEQDLLPALFGTVPLRPPLGLYVNTYEGQLLEPGHLSFATLQYTDGSGDVAGLVLTLGVLNFLLITSPRFTLDAPSKARWHRHQTLVLNVNTKTARYGYLFTY